MIWIIEFKKKKKCGSVGIAFLFLLSPKNNKLGTNRYNLIFVLLLGLVVCIYNIIICKHIPTYIYVLRFRTLSISDVSDTLTKRFKFKKCSNYF